MTTPTVELVESALHASWLVSARMRTEKKGHVLGAFRKNGTTQPVYVAQCSRCLCYCLVDPLRMGPKDDGQVGVALYWPCDAPIDKNCEFSRGDMSSEHRAVLNQPWKAPSEK